MKIKKRIYYIFLVLFSTSYLLTAQTNYFGSLGGSIGYVQDGFGFEINYNYNLNRYECLQGNVMFNFSKKKYKGYKIPTQIYTINSAYFKNVWDSRRKKITQSLGAGITLGYERLNKNSKDLPDGALLLSNSKFIFGPFVASDTEFYLNDFYSLILKAQESYQINSEAGKFIPFISIGLRYFIY